MSCPQLESTPVREVPDESANTITHRATIILVGEYSLLSLDVTPHAF